MARETVVLGAGPAGLWTALTLLREQPGSRVTVLEKGSVPGGIASSFRRNGLTWDLGSHRFHPSASEEVFSSVRELLGDDLLERPRNGRIRLEGRFLKYPLKPLDMLRHLPPSFTLGVILDALASPFRPPAPPEASFKETLRAGLGPTICRRFYFPYARKLWGLDPGELDGEQARRRVSASKLSRMIGKIAGFQVSGGKGSVFHYPRGGFGTMFQRAAAKIEELGGKVLLNAVVTGVRPTTGTGRGGVTATVSGRETFHPSDFTFSTLPVTELAGLIEPPPGDEVLNSAASLRYRSMVLCFISFPCPSFTRFDAHYFPDCEILFSRISERKNYEDTDQTPDRTGLCVEIPCWKTDPVWTMEDGELVETVIKELRKAGFSVPAPESGFSGRIEHAYPSYPSLWLENYRIVDSWLRKVQGVVSLGRQGIFAHDNTHHAMEMGIEAARCYDGNRGWNPERWAQARETFRKHVVED